MELYEVMRTTFSAREFTDDPVTDEQLIKIFENARFASSGGNRQGWRVIVVRDQATRARLGELALPAARRYIAQRDAGEGPWNPVTPPGPDAEAIAQTEVPANLTSPITEAPVLLVVCVDLRVVAAIDQDLDRIAVVPGGSVYPFTWNILLAARNEGLGGTLTTMPIAQEPEIATLLGMPDYAAVAAVIPMGKPVRQLTKLRRNPVSSFATRERWDGEAVTE